MFYSADQRDREKLPHDPLKALIAPRPIGWISSRNRQGAVNLAPFSFFNAFSTAPMILGFATDGEKDSLVFARESGEFVWNLVNAPLLQAMNATSAVLPRGDSEFTYAGLTEAACVLVAAPRVAESPAALECKVVEVIELKNHKKDSLGSFLVLGEVVGVHIDDRFIQAGKVDTAALQLVARCGYNDYAQIDHLFELKRPEMKNI